MIYSGQEVMGPPNDPATLRPYAKTCDSPPRYTLRAHASWPVARTSSRAAIAKKRCLALDIARTHRSHSVAVSARKSEPRHSASYGGEGEGCSGVQGDD